MYLGRICLVHVAGREDPSVAPKSQRASSVRPGQVMFHFVAERSLMMQLLALALDFSSCLYPCGKSFPTELTPVDQLTDIEFLCTASTSRGRCGNIWKHYRGFSM